MSNGGLPIGLQLVGPQHGDLVVLRTAAALEAAIDLDSSRPCPPESDHLHPKARPDTQHEGADPMSITSPANPSDAVRLVTDDDAPWADTGIGVLLKVVRFDSCTGPGSSSTASIRRAAADAPPHRVGGRLHLGGTLALPRVRLLRDGRFLPVRTGQLGAHLARAEDNTEDTDVCFIIEGALLNLADDGSVESVSDGPGTLEAYYACSRRRATRAPTA